LQLYTSAVTDVLDLHRGEWGAGLFYAGGYRVEFGSVRRGGRSFLQTAKVLLEVEASS
jgi:hypothetical protein